jgi:hypothetical protein
MLRRGNRLYLVDDPWLLPMVPNTVLTAMRKNVHVPARGAMARPPLSDIWLDA